MNTNVDVSKSLIGLVMALLPAGAGLAADMTLTVRDVPVPGLVCVKPAKPLDAKASYTLKADNQAIPAQLDQDGKLCWYQPKPCTGDERCTYTISIDPAGKAGKGGVKVEQAAEGLINVSIDGQPFSAFNYAKNLPKPFLYPVFGPTGATVTRHYPMKNVPFEPEERRDHPHHRSLWTAHGDVRLGDFKKTGTDYWAQDEEGTPARKGLQKVAKVTRMQSGPVFGLIEADIDWVTPSGVKELSETRTYTFYKTSRDERVVDVKVALKFTEADVMFADTKEGGILSLRVATSMDEVTGGHMVNSKGQNGMKECWGQEADWCDYVGQVDGQTVGIAVFDAKTNFRHPTRWHIRDYGLYTANPFMAGAATKEYKKKDPNVKVEDGSKIWKKGETEKFNYRILIHKDDTQAAKVAEQYKLYTEQPKAILK